MRFAAFLALLLPAWPQTKSPIKIPASQTWTDTAVELRAGDSIGFEQHLETRLRALTRHTHPEFFDGGLGI